MSTLVRVSSEGVGSAAELNRPPATRGRLGRITVLLAAMTVLLLAGVGWRFLSGADWMMQWPDVVVSTLNFITLAVALTLVFVWTLVVVRWRAGSVDSTRRLTLQQLQRLSPAEFEQYVAELFRGKGYDVVVRGRSGDKGVDLVLEQEDGRRAIVQCKRYRSTVGPEIVRELYGTLIHERAAHAFLVTTAGISDGARQWARGKPITLIDGRTLAGIIMQPGRDDDDER